METEKKLIYADDARRAILETEPKLAYCIDRIKGVDAVEVVHGRWMEFNTFMTCSVCDKDWYYGDNNCDEFDYCPNCGAKMTSNVSSDEKR